MLKRNKTNEELEKEIEQLKKVIGTMIQWICQSANSPLNQAEGKKLVEMLEGN